MTMVAVYGTLRKGGRLNGYLGGRTMRASTRIAGYKMYSYLPEWFPSVKRTDDPEDSILVEVYDVCSYTLKSLDMVEGVPTLYQREAVDIPGIGECFIYLRVDDPPPGAVEIPNGDWMKFISKENG